jgi:anthranilate phosphoribosyltransferase
VVLLNAGAALVVAGRAGDLANGVTAARDALDAGLPRDLLGPLRAATPAGASA